MIPHDQKNVYIYNDINDIVRASMEHDCHQIILGGDLNTNFLRKSSLHSLALTEFMTDQYRKCSTEDHFIMTENLFNLVNKF